MSPLSTHSRPRTRGGRALDATLLVVAVLTTGAVLGSTDVLGRDPAAATVGAMAACTWFVASRPLASALALIAGGLALTEWPVSTLVLAASLVAAVVGATVQPDGVRPAWHRPAARFWLIGLALGALSAGALVGWFALFAPDYPRIHTPVVGGVQLPVLMAAPLLACGNSLAEELFWRVLVLGVLRHRLGVAQAIAVQATAFGVMHWRGYPSGAIGVLLTILFGVLAGLLVERSKSMWPAVTAHVLADVAVLLHLLAV